MLVYNDDVPCKWLQPGQRHVNIVIEEQIEGPQYPRTTDKVLGSLVLLVNKIFWYALEYSVEHMDCEIVSSSWPM